MINLKTTTALCVATAFFSINAVASTLPQATLNTCKDYITNPTPASAKTNAEALTQCYQNNVCQDQLAGISGCTQQLESWNLNYSPKSAVAATPAPVETVAPAAPKIPALFHSTSPNQPEAATTPAIPAQPTQETVAAPTQTTPTQQQEEPTQNQKKPSINWF